MYAGFFGLRQSPFSIAPDPHFLYLSERHREALAHLLYGVQGGGGFVLLTGEIGAGKTTVCRAFVQQMPAHCRVAYIFNPQLTVMDLLQTICHEFHIRIRPDDARPATIKDYLDPLNDHLLACHAQGLQNLLIIDEAQGLTAPVLEQLRLLTNLETAERKLLQIMLIGQPELRQMLAQPELEQVAQRVIARYHLDALGAAETRQYIQHRMGVAGLAGPLPFHDAALERIHAITRGVPRRINLLCDRALLGAYACQQPMVTVAIVQRAAAEVFDSPNTGSDTAGRRWHRVGPRLGWGALGGLVALAVAAAVWRPWRAPPAPVAAADRSPVPAAAPAAMPAANPTPTRLAPEPVGVDTPPPLAQLLPDEASGWQALGPLWGHALPTRDPCATAQTQGLQCFRTPRMTLQGLRQLDRPGLLTLHLPNGSAHAVLTALAGDTVTLQAGQRQWRLSTSALARHWRGDYATLWRTPPGTQGRIGNVNTGPAADWASDRLTALQAAGGLPAEAKHFVERLAAFQHAQGIDGKGRVTPMTFMQINRLSGVDEPRLSPRRPTTTP